MKIPKRFRLMGHVIEVKVDKKFCNLAEENGHYRHNDKVIVLEGMTGSANGATFCHELIHALLSHTGYYNHKLNKNENFVDRLGEALYQALSTMEY